MEHVGAVVSDAAVSPFTKPEVGRRDGRHRVTVGNEGRRRRDRQRGRRDQHRAVHVGDGVVGVDRPRAAARVAPHRAGRAGRGGARGRRGERRGGVPVHEARVRGRDGGGRAAVGHRPRGGADRQRRRVHLDRAGHVGDGVVGVHRPRAAARVAPHRAGRAGRGGARGRRGERRGGVTVHEARVRGRDGGGRAAVGHRPRGGADHQSGAPDHDGAVHVGDGVVRVRGPRARTRVAYPPSWPSWPWWSR